MAKDLRTYIKELLKNRPDDVKVVTKEVDPVFEVTAILEKLQKQGKYPTVLFKKVKGSKLPLLINLHATYERLALAFDTTVDRMVETYAQREGRPLEVKKVSTGPVKDIILKGKDASLDKIPLTRHCALDAGKYISAGVAIVKDPESGKQNCGIYRHQMHTNKQLGLFVNPANHANYIRLRHVEINKPMEIAIVIGHHPCFQMAAVSKLEGLGGEMEVAGALLGEPLSVVKCETIGLYVPAYAEIVIEGIVPLNVSREEGPFGEWPGYYTGLGERPVINVTAITMKKDAVYLDLFNAHPEHNLLGALPRMGSILRRTKEAVPSVKAVNLPISGGGRVYCYISMKKNCDGEPKQAAFAALTTEPNITEVVVVDDDINVYNETEVLWAKATRFDASRDLVIMPDCLGSHLIPTAYDITHLKHGVMQTKLIVDATKPAPPTYFPARARVPEEIVDKINVDKFLVDYKKIKKLW